MSLGKARTRIKEGVKEIQSTQGLKRVAVNMGMGATIGFIFNLILTYIHLQIAVAVGGLKNLYVVGFSIYPDHLDIDGNPYIYYAEILQIIVTVFLLTTKKLWFVVGFFLGWYFSGYLGLYDALGLPVPEEGL